MELYINTGSKSLIILELKQNKKIIARKEIAAPHRQSEKLLLNIDKILKDNKQKLSDLKDILVETRGEGFTSLRIGVVTANALAYALKDKFKIARPEYSNLPNITLKK